MYPHASHILTNEYKLIIQLKNELNACIKFSHNFDYCLFYTQSFNQLLSLKIPSSKRGSINKYHTLLKFTVFAWKGSNYQEKR